MQYPENLYGSKITNNQHDPLGEAVKDYFFSGNTKAEVSVALDISEETETIPVKHLFRSYVEMPDLEKIALAECSGKVLDVGAGAGSHSLYLQEKGLDVTALDISPGAIEVMQSRGIQKVLHEDFFQLKGHHYDTILMLMNGIGIVGDIERLNTFLKHGKSLLNPGGKIILDSSDIMYMFEDEDGSVKLDLTKYYGEVTYQMSYKGVAGKPFKWLYIGQIHFEDIARDQGFLTRILFEGAEFEYLASLEMI